MLDLIHGKVRILFQSIQLCAILRIPCDAAGNAQVQYLAIRKRNRLLVQLFPQLGEYLADFILTFIAVEQQMEFIAGNPGTQGILWCIVCEASACLSDILIAPVMPIGIIGILEVVHVQHKQGSMLQLFWFGEK